MAPGTHLSTGLSNLDESLGGGLPTGTLLVLTAPVGASAELLCDTAARETPHPTAFITTSRPEWRLHELLDQHESAFDAVESSAPTRRILGVAPDDLGTELPPAPVNLNATSDNGIVDTPEQTETVPTEDGSSILTPTTEGVFSDALRWIATQNTPLLVVDALSDAILAAEQGTSPAADTTEPGWTKALDWTYALTHATGGLAILLLESPVETPPSRGEQLVLRRADAVFNYIRRGDTDRLVVSKLRGYTATGEADGLPFTQKLDIESTIGIDPSQSL